MSLNQNSTSQSDNTLTVGKKPAATCKRSFREIPFANRMKKQPEWSEAECRLSFARLMPYLIEPQRGGMRRRVLTLFYLQLLQTLEGQDEDTRKMRSYLEKMVGRNRSALYKTGSYESYLNAFLVDGGRNDLCIREVVTTGLTVKVLASEHSIKQRGARTLRGAQEYIVDNYETGVVLANDYSVRKAWFYNKPVAHLCAAFVDFLQATAGRTLCIDYALLQKLQRQMDNFVVTAGYYQSFLTGQLIVANTPLSSKLQTNLSLMHLPVLALTAPAYGVPDLPRWDLSRSRGVNPTSFDPKKTCNGNLGAKEHQDPNLTAS